MPRANRHFLPGQLWHITHRCHEKSFLLKFARDRRRYREIQEPRGGYTSIFGPENDALRPKNTVP